MGGIACRDDWEKMDDGLDLLADLDLDIPERLDFVGAEPAGSVDQGTFFGPYQVIARIGHGGVARVMRARHIHPSYSDHTFAIKVLHDELAGDERVVSFFRNEAFLLSMLKHPNIVQTFEAGTQDDKVFIAMEYIDGRDLDEMVARCQKFKIQIPTSVSLFIMTEVLSALAYAHDLTDGDGRALRLTHRDINPANVFMSYRGHVKLGDFGVASLTFDRVEKNPDLAGKLGYFAPEQLEGKPVDQRADLFAMGVMMFEIFTGQRLFDGGDQQKVMRRNRKAKVPKPSKLNPGIAPEIEAVILKALERRPEDRFQSAPEMLNALLPCAPSPIGMPLAVASLMRMVFLQEHIEELQLRQGLSGGSTTRGSGQNVALLTADSRAQVAFSELLSSRGYCVSAFLSATEFENACQRGFGPDVVMLGLEPAVVVELSDGLKGIPSQAYVIGVCEHLDPSVCALAERLGVADLISKPFNAERVLTAVRSAVVDNVATARSPGRVARANRTKVLLISEDFQFASTVSHGLSAQGLTVDISPTAVEAMQRTSETSYEGIVLDAGRGPSAALAFTRNFRSCPGMGLVPVVYLASPEAIREFGDLTAERSEVLPRSRPPIDIHKTLQHLIADTRVGRSFSRFDADFPLELRFGGRVFEATAVNLSRAGLMLRCQQLPSVGEPVSVNFRLGSDIDALEVNGTVIRVDMAPVEGELPQIGVSFDRFVGRGEANLIKYLARLDGHADPGQSVIFGSPAPA